MLSNWGTSGLVQHIMPNKIAAEIVSVKKIKLSISSLLGGKYSHFETRLFLIGIEMVVSIEALPIEKRMKDDEEKDVENREAKQKE